jgi:hypothetical protein
MLPVKAGPVPDRLTIWPVDDRRYGLDATRCLRSCTDGLCPSQRRPRARVRGHELRQTEIRMARGDRPDQVGRPLG